MMRAKTALTSLSLLLALSLSGCGSDSALTDYTSQMNTFYDAFSSGTLALEQIDPSSETAQEELLSGLDELTALTDSLADISVPKRYADAGIDELAARRRNTCRKRTACTTKPAAQRLSTRNAPAPHRNIISAQ